MGTTATTAGAFSFPFACSPRPAYGSALAAGGALTLWLAQSRRAWVVISLVTVSLGYCWHRRPGHYTPLLPESSQPVAPFHTGTPEPLRVNLALDRLYVSTAEFLPKTAHLTTWHEDEARGFWLYERMFPEAAWLGGRVTVWSGTMAIRQLSGGSLWTSADVTVAGGRAGGPRLPPARLCRLARLGG